MKLHFFRLQWKAITKQTNSYQQLKSAYSNCSENELSMVAEMFSHKQQMEIFCKRI